MKVFLEILFELAFCFVGLIEKHLFSGNFNMYWLILILMLAALYSTGRYYIVEKKNGRLFFYIAVAFALMCNTLKVMS